MAQLTLPDIRPLPTQYFSILNKALYFGRLGPGRKQQPFSKTQLSTYKLDLNRALPAPDLTFTVYEHSGVCEYRIRAQVKSLSAR